MNFNSNTTQLVLQTYPQLTTNIKVVVEDEDNFFLNSIPASAELEGKALQRVSIYKDTKFGTMLSRFWKNFDGGSMYYIGDSSLYASGPAMDTSPYYTPRFHYLAPLWLSTNLTPDYFMVFKIADFDYTTFEEVDLDTFYKTTLFKSEIIKFVDLTKPNIKALFDQLYASATAATYETTNDDRIVNLNGISAISGYSNQFPISLDNRFESIESQLFDVYPNSSLISNKLVNFEFLFDDEANVAGDPNMYFGAYFTKEELCKFSIDIKQHNIDANIPPVDKYKNTNNGYPLANSDGVVIHVDTFDIDLSELFFYECLTTGNDYGFTYNPYCPGSLETEIQYGQIDATGFADSTFTEWVGKYGYNIDYWIYCDYDYDYLNRAEGKYFYAVGDRNDYIYNIKNFARDITLVNATAYLDGFYGTREDLGINIPGKKLFTASPSSLRMEFKRSGINPVFDNGDWLQIKAGFNKENYVWRVFADTGNCCSGSEYCYYEAPTINIESCDIKFVRHHNSIVLDVKFDKFIKFEEGDSITLYCEKFKEAVLTISKVTYNHTDETVSLTIVDLLGTYFRDCNTVRTMFFTYTGTSYYYTYFNPKGNFKEIGQRLEYAFNTFPNRLYEASEFENKVIFQANHPGVLYANFNLDYNFTKSKTQTGDVIVNDVPLKGTPVFDSNLYELFTRKRGKEIWFTGGNSQDYGNRFYVDKAWALANMNGGELIALEGNRKSPLKVSGVEGTDTFYSSYIEEPVKFEGKILKYLNSDKYVTMEIESNDSKVAMTSNKVIGATYPYKPVLLKFLILGRGTI